jgi:hypothetical protein
LSGLGRSRRRAIHKERATATSSAASSAEKREASTSSGLVYIAVDPVVLLLAIALAAARPMGPIALLIAAVLLALW